MTRKSYEDAANEIDELKDSGRELDGLRPVQAKLKQNADSIYSVRFTRDEIKLLRQAAAERGVKLSELIRDGALTAALAGRDPKNDNAVENVQAAIYLLAKSFGNLERGSNARPLLTQAATKELLKALEAAASKQLPEDALRSLAESARRAG